MKSTSESTEWENESSGSGGDDFIGFEKTWSDSESCYSSDGSDESSLPDSPIPEDTNSKFLFRYYNKFFNWIWIYNINLYLKILNCYYSSILARSN